MTLIMGADSERQEAVQRAMAERGATDEFVSVFIPLIYAACARYGLDATYVVAQSAKETDGGRYTGTVPRWFNNLAGIKVHPKEQAALPNGIGANNALWAHQRYATLTQGALSQAQHLRAYCKPVPEAEVIAPRSLYVAGRGRLIKNWEDITWAGPEYGTEVVRLGLMLIETGL